MMTADVLLLVVGGSLVVLLVVGRCIERETEKSKEGGRPAGLVGVGLGWVGLVLLFL